MNPYKCNKPKWEPEKWNLSKKEHDLTNCYSYAFDTIIKEGERHKKLQPGELSGNRFNKYDCNSIINKVKKDYALLGIRKLKDMHEEIECTNYRIALVIDNKGNDIDYHFYRQDSNNKWSHKAGDNEVSNVDASNNIIIDPEKADRNYNKYNNGNYDYSIFCGYYSVPYTKSL
jgi:hypothetical protein